jgi:hypothetical protein
VRSSTFSRRPDCQSVLVDHDRVGERPADVDSHY